MALDDRLDLYAIKTQFERMRFAAGEPFHAGKAWQMMDVGISAMSGMLAD